MNYHPKDIEEKWQRFWKNREVFKSLSVIESQFVNKLKYYILDMFPYPSGFGLHVGHLLGYVASDIIARFKRHQGFNVLHPMGYDSFGLPAEQYAIETGQHPEITIKNNIKRYRKQLDLIGFSFDWNREINTSDKKYYKWTQYFFIKLFHSWYNKKTNQADSIKNLIIIFEKEGNFNVQAETSQTEIFSSLDWISFSEKKKSDILLCYRLMYLDKVEVNWCPNLKTVLANDEIINGVSERGGHEVIRRKMIQWMIRITAYADRLLLDLDDIDWSNSIKEIQKNWIGKEDGILLKFVIVSSFIYDSFVIEKLFKNRKQIIEIFIKQPEIIFGITYIILSHDHPLILDIINYKYRDIVLKYLKQISKINKKSDIKNSQNINGIFTGSYVIHPFTKELLPIWISSYIVDNHFSQSSAIGVPIINKKDFIFSKYFELPIKNIFLNTQNIILINSNFLNGLNRQQANKKIIEEIIKNNLGKRKVNYKLHDVVFSRQRYWGEPIPIYFKKTIPYTISIDKLPLVLPKIQKYLPTEKGEPPLGNAIYWAWDENKQEVVDKKLIDEKNIFPLDLNTMPSWAGSSWYFNRYMDPTNNNVAFSKINYEYWKKIDLYFGGSEHAIGHLLYSRFFQKFLYDLGKVSCKEYSHKLVNQGLLLSYSAWIYRVKNYNQFISKKLINNYITFPIRVDIKFIDENNILNIKRFQNSKSEYKHAKFICEEDGNFYVYRNIEKMSKSKYNVIIPDLIVKKFGADTLRMYEMFLGPLDQSKLWNMKGILGVFNFLKKFWKMYHVDENELLKKPSQEILELFNQTIKKVVEGMESFSFNTSISSFMIITNSLFRMKCFSREILEPLCILISPYAPHIAEELWYKFYPEKYKDLSYKGISYEPYPLFKQEFLNQKIIKKYPIAFNGKIRFFIELSLELTKQQIEKIILNEVMTKKYLKNKSVKKFIFIPKKIINLVF